MNRVVFSILFLITSSANSIDSFEASSSTSIGGTLLFSKSSNTLKSNDRAIIALQVSEVEKESRTSFIHVPVINLHSHDINNYNSTETGFCNVESWAFSEIGLIGEYVSENPYVISARSDSRDYYDDYFITYNDIDSYPKKITLRLKRTYKKRGTDTGWYEFSNHSIGIKVGEPACAKD